MKLVEFKEVNANTNFNIKEAMEEFDMFKTKFSELSEFIKV